MLAGKKLNVDKANFSRKFLLAVLTNPYNDTPKNIMVKTVVTESGIVTHQLFTVSNWQVFAVPISKNKANNTIENQSFEEEIYSFKFKCKDSDFLL